MCKVLLTWATTMTLVAGVLLPSHADATTLAKPARAGDGSIEVSSQNKPHRVIIMKKVTQKKIGARLPRPSPKLNPQPEPPRPMR